jgi:hypothetical protein
MLSNSTVSFCLLKQFTGSTLHYIATDADNHVHLASRCQMMFFFGETMCVVVGLECWFEVLV